MNTVAQLQLTICTNDSIKIKSFCFICQSSPVTPSAYQATLHSTAVLYKQTISKANDCVIAGFRWLFQMVFSV